MRKLSSIFLSILLIIGVLAGCSSQSGQTIKVGISSSDTKVWEFIKQQAQKEGLDIQIVTFNDYVQPNLALSDGSLDANAFQTVSYFNEFKKQRNLDLTAIGSTVLAPMGVYSKKYKNITQIPNGATITIPNEASNGGRALLLLEKAGLLKLKEGFNGKGLTEVIESNPKNLKIVTVAAPQTPRSMDDAAAAVINNGIAVSAGLSPVKDPIFSEDKTAKPYINIIATQTKNKDNANLKKLVKIYQSPEVAEYIKKVYNGGVIPTIVPVSEIENL
jgi:D-methionine transport system substrate-binding protein